MTLKATLKLETIRDTVVQSCTLCILNNVQCYEACGGGDKTYFTLQKLVHKGDKKVVYLG